ncbi:uncharacterized protein VTP21DRAFT_6417 [Calcarisporiella thermophila]|uniref:uncharacterized protein n=1 Tax=Calcarisporiella thermophila TaxID=911321 RepID=UPI00374333AD
MYASDSLQPRVKPPTRSSIRPLIITGKIHRKTAVATPRPLPLAARPAAFGTRCHRVYLQFTAEAVSRAPKHQASRKPRGLASAPAQALAPARPTAALRFRAQLYA